MDLLYLSKIVRMTDKLSLDELKYLVECLKENIKEDEESI